MMNAWSSSSPPARSPAAKRKVHVRRDEDGQIVGAGGAGDGEGEDQEQTTTRRPPSKPPLLHFSSPRDAATIAAFLRTRVYRPESLVWLEGYQALIRWRAENEITGVYAVPYDAEVEVGVTKDFPLGRWVHQQRKALRAGELEERRKTLLDAPEAGMVWEPGEEAWETKLAALRSYRRATGHLAPRQDAVWGEGEAMVPVGQHMANLRRKGGLGKDPERAARARAAAGRDRRGLGLPVAAGLAAALPRPRRPGRRRRRPARHRTRACCSRATTSGGGCSGRRTRAPGRSFSPSSRNGCPRWAYSPLRPRPPPRQPARTAKGPSKAQQAFQRGLAALTQWVEREGADRPVPRGHSEEITVDGEAEPVIVKLGVWVSNTKSRRDKLTEEQLDALRKLGVKWT